MHRFTSAKTALAALLALTALAGASAAQARADLPVAVEFHPASVHVPQAPATIQHGHCGFQH